MLAKIDKTELHTCDGAAAGFFYNRSPGKRKMPTSICPLCDGRVFVDASTDLGDQVVCDECEQRLELVGLDPIELDPLPVTSEYPESDFNIFDNED